VPAQRPHYVVLRVRYPNLPFAALGMTFGLIPLQWNRLWFFIYRLLPPPSFQSSSA